MAKFCVSCGSPLEEGAAHCTACGAKCAEVITESKKPNETLDNISLLLLAVFVAVEKFLFLVGDKISELCDKIFAKKK